MTRFRTNQPQPSRQPYGRVSTALQSRRLDRSRAVLTTPKRMIHGRTRIQRGLAAPNPTAGARTICPTARTQRRRVHSATPQRRSPNQHESAQMRIIRHGCVLSIGMCGRLGPVAATRECSRMTSYARYGPASLRTAAPLITSHTCPPDSRWVVASAGPSFATASVLELLGFAITEPFSS